MFSSSSNDYDIILLRGANMENYELKITKQNIEDVAIFSDKILEIYKNRKRIERVTYDDDSITIKFDNIKNLKTINLSSKKEDFDFSSFYVYFTIFLRCELVNPMINSFEQKYRYIKAFIQSLRLNAIVIVDSKDMLDLNYELSKRTESNYYHPLEIREDDIYECFNVLRKTELMGCFITLDEHNKVKSQKLNGVLEKISNQNININELQYLIFICPENIEFFINHINKKHRKTILSNEVLTTIVFSHELGHLVFSEDNPLIVTTADEFKKKERQANLVASYFNKGMFDNEIKLITDNQLIEYRNPLLISERYKNKSKFKKELEQLYGE